MSTTRAEPGWADVLVDYAADIDTAERLIRQLIAAQVSSWTSGGCFETIDVIGATMSFV